jgi:hypothetical protein
MMPSRKTELRPSSKTAQPPKEGAVTAMDSESGNPRKSPRPLKEKKSGLKTKATKATSASRSTAKPKEAPAPQPQQEAVCLTPPAKLEGDYPHHLKWQEGGISFELHSTDAAFMNRQAWRVQTALAGLSPNNHKALQQTKAALSPIVTQAPVATSVPHYTPQPKMYYIPQTLPDAPHEWLQQVQHALHASHHPKTDDFDTDSIQAWLQASEAKVAQLNLPKAKAKISNETAVGNNALEPQNSMEHIMASTLKALQADTTPKVIAPPQETVTPDKVVDLPIQREALAFDATLYAEVKALEAQQNNIEAYTSVNAAPPTPTPVQVITAENTENEAPGIFNTMLRGIHNTMGYEKKPSTQTLPNHTTPNIASPKKTSLPPITLHSETVASTLPEEYMVSSSESSSNLKLQISLQNALNVCNTLSERVLLCGCLLAQRFPNPAFSMAMLKSEAERLKAGSVSYSAVQQSLDQGYIAVVPDLTGNADSMMYEVTPIGKSYAASLCK